MLEELVQILRGWASYFSLVDVKHPLEALDGWSGQRSAPHYIRIA
ncbi:group II intron maturase-specific domain-containing protein [Vreelandella arcis]|nr:group II intron maturase-specific domain-containing protein [Halomonas arcis]